MWRQRDCADNMGAQGIYRMQRLLGVARPVAGPCDGVVEFSSSTTLRRLGQE